MRRHIASIEADAESLRRGGSTRTAICVCGWRGAQRASLELAADDALLHEGSTAQIDVAPRSTASERRRREA